MGYVIFIQRSGCSDKPASPISLEEWSSVATADGDFETDGSYEGSYQWVSHPDKPYFDYYGGGSIGVSYRDGPTFRKMFEIAAKLDARLQGESGECYRPTAEGAGQFFEEPTSYEPQIIRKW